MTAAVAMAYLIAAVGVPLPSGPAKDRGIAFPCMDRGCGCHDAAGCKEHCCCFSSDEKLAWAADHHVDPAPFVDPRALAARMTASRHRHDASHGENVADTSCCSKRVARRAADRWAEPISIAAYRQCTGSGPLWSLLGAALPPAERAAYEFERIVTGQVAQRNRAAIFISFPPSTPPPRS